MSAYLLLEDGARFDGEACGAPGHAVGEVVFTTGMSGYQECMSDPSFHAQLITFTAPISSVTFLMPRSSHQAARSSLIEIWAVGLRMPA